MKQKYLYWAGMILVWSFAAYFGHQALPEYAPSSSNPQSTFILLVVVFLGFISPTIAFWLSESRRSAQSVEPIKKTATELMIEDVEFPSGFEPRYVAMDDSSCWHAFQEKPMYHRNTGEWQSPTLLYYELGIDDSDSQEYTPEFARGISPDGSLFEVAGCELN